MTIRIRIAALAGAIALACSAMAQPAPDQDSSYQAGAFENVVSDSSSRVVDPPTRVARLASLSGDVSFAPAGESDWSRAQRNRPMVTGDKLYTNTDGRAELQVGASTIHVDQRTNMDFLTLNDQTAQIELTQGALDVDVRRMRSGEVYEVDTPTIAFVADRVGDYRIDVDPNGQATTVSVRRGSGEAVGEGGKRVRIEEGQSIVFNDAQLNDYRNLAQRRSDSFDTYATQRDERYDRGVSRNYVSEDVVGYEDLDDNGTWEDAPEYGHVWYPHSVAADWAPYHDGNWDWVEPYGWTWVDNAPWGFAPFHYGRWAYVGSRWGWVPGPVDVRPVYAPALVAFVGGGGFGIDISIGGPIGWFALGPGDVYFPGYRCGRNYFNSVNISNTVVNNTVINNYYGAFSADRVNYAQMNYANRMAPRAMTAMPTAAFASGRPVAASAIAVNRTMLANARVLPRATVAPTAASLVANRGRAMAPPAEVRNRSVVAAIRPAPVPASFAQRQALLRKNPPGQPLTAAQMRTVATGANAHIPAMTRGNVRMAGTSGARAVNAQGNARPMPGTSNARGAPRSNAATAATTARATPSRGKAVATHESLPSARYSAAMRGSNDEPRGSAKAVSAPQRGSAAARASTNASVERGAVPKSRESATVRANASTNARIERGGNAPMRSSAYAAQNRANVQDSSGRRGSGPMSNPSEQRVQAQTLQRDRTPVRTQPQREVSQYHKPQPATRATEQQHAQAQYRAPREQPRAQAQQYRAPQPAREQPRVQAQQYRASPPVARVTERQHAQAQYRAPQPAREQPRAQAQQYRAPQPAARVSEQPRAQAQYRQPSRPTSQREQAPQRQAKRKDEKRDQGGGG